MLLRPVPPPGLSVDAPAERPHTGQNRSREVAAEIDGLAPLGGIDVR